MRGYHTRDGRRSTPTSCATCGRRCSCCGAACCLCVLIAAVNITNLSLVRASGRLKELATRNALGAGAWPRGAATGHRVAAAHDHRRRRWALRRLLEPRRARVAGPLRPAACARDPDGRHGARPSRSAWRRCSASSSASRRPCSSSRLNLSNVLREEGRTGTAGRGRALRRGAAWWSSQVAHGVRAADRRRSAAGQLPAHCWASIPASSPNTS